MLIIAYPIHVCFLLMFNIVCLIIINMSMYVCYVCL